MSKISEEKMKRIKGAVCTLLYEKHPKTITANKIAEELVRDNEFISKILKDLESERIVLKTRKKEGKVYKWMLTSAAKKIYDERL